MSHSHTPIDAHRRRVLAAFGAAGLSAAGLSAAGFGHDACAAQAGAAWPADRPINYVVPFPAGGLTDVAARQVAKALSDAEKWNVVIENKPGGNANIGAAFVSRAPADGYTWLAMTLSHAANATLFEGRAGYELLKDLTPIAGLASSPIMVVVSSKSPIKSMQDLADASKTKALSTGSSGNGTPPHLTMALYQKITGAKLMHVPYKGGSPSLTDLIGGHVDVVFSNYPESLAFVKSGELRALAVTTKTRTKDLPDVPTVAEVGLPDLVVENFTGVMGPAGMPPEIVTRVSRAIVTQLSKPAMAQSLTQLGFMPQPRDAQAFGAYLAGEVTRWRGIIKEANITTS